jgi:hypothetical protein
MNDTGSGEIPIVCDASIVGTGSTCCTDAGFVTNRLFITTFPLTVSNTPQIVSPDTDAIGMVVDSIVALPLVKSFHIFENPVYIRTDNTHDDVVVLGTDLKYFAYRFPVPSNANWWYAVSYDTPDMGFPITAGKYVAFDTPGAVMFDHTPFDENPMHRYTYPDKSYV